jgi:hypothetical protein
MKLLSCALLLMASMAFVLLGCSDRSTPIATPTDQMAPPVSATGLAKGGVLHAVTGSANCYAIIDPATGFIFPGPKQKGGFYNVVTVNAVDQGNGVYAGRFINQFQGKVPEEWNWGFAARVEAKVKYLAVEGNMALVVAEITSMTIPEGFPPGPWWVAQVFIDNGEGGPGGSPDETGALWATPDPAEAQTWMQWTPQEYLDWTITIPGNISSKYPVDKGNIQVR